MTDALPAGVTLQENTLAFLNDGPKKLFINNEWVPAHEGGTIETLNPANGRVLTRVAQATSQDVDDAVTAARSAFNGEWGQMAPADRGELLWKLADKILEHADELAELETLDNGMSYRASRHGNLPLIAKHIRYYAGWTTKIEGTTIPTSIPNTFTYTLREPMGVVGLIIPWNFPLLMCAWKLAPALACGNTAILKPAEQTPLSALRLAELIAEVGFPAGTVNVLTGTGESAGAPITAHNGIDKVAFTGSTAVGRKILAASAHSNLKRVSLELGGKSPNVIFADANIGQAIKGATWAVFSNTGQECIAGSRLFVQRPVFDQVVEGLAEQAGRIRVGDGFGKVHLGPIISDDQLQQILGYIDDGKQNGAEMVTGGERLNGEMSDGYFIKPTIFTHENDALDLVQEEIFGPVVAVTPFDEWEELVARANDTNYGLAAGVWTQDVSKAHRFAQAVQAGNVYVNRYGLFDPAVPFGGYKESGFGREMGKEAIELYTQTKTVWVGL